MMKPLMLSWMVLLFATSCFAAIDGVGSDTFAAHSPSCSGDSFSCGSNTDLIVDTGGSYNVTLSSDDHLSTMVCAVSIQGVTATVRSCLVRNGFTNQSCNSFSEINLGNHSYYYVCPSGMSCAWNGQNSIPVFGTSPITVGFQVNTTTPNTEQFIFTSYVCNSSVLNTSTQGITQYFRIASIKGTYCSGNGYESAVFDRTGVTPLSNVQSCSSGFCDQSLLSNVSMSANITGNVCTPGCHDFVKDGSETDIDYGGVICGNCTSAGKQSDSFYPIAVALQEGNTSVLNGANPFNASLYCTQGEHVGVSITTAFLLLLLVSSVTIGLLLLFIFGGSAFFSGTIIRYIRRKRKKE